MSSYNFDTVWKGGGRFDTQIGNHLITMDATPPHGTDTGPSPKRLMLITIAGCTGLDVVSLLNKMRVKFSDFHMNVKADLSDDHPVTFSHIYLTYYFKGKDLNRKRIKRAIDLSQERYCGVSTMFKSHCTVEISIEFTDE